MTLPLATDRLIRVAAQQAWGDRPRLQRMLLLRARPEWPHDQSLDSPVGALRVLTGESALAVDDALASTGDQDRVVVLTNLTERDLGVSLLARAVGQRVHTVDRWDAVRSAFSVPAESSIDPMLVRGGDEVAEALLSHAPPEGWPAPPVGVLTRDYAMGVLARRLLSLPSPLDLSQLLSWTTDAGATLRLHRMDAGLRDSLAHWITDQVGAGAAPVLGLSVRGEGNDAVALGIAADALWSAPDAARAQGRFEQAYLGTTLADTARVAWSATARGWMERSIVNSPTTVEPILQRAQAVLEELERPDLAKVSSLLPAGFESRLVRVIEAVPLKLRSPSLREAEVALDDLRMHTLRPLWESRLQLAEMALRVVRWLAQPEEEPTTVEECLTWQSTIGGWVDLARQVLVNGDPNPRVGDTLRRIDAAASRRRRRIDRAAAVLIAEATEQDRPFGGVIPVEAALDEVILPLAQHSPILMVVLDGMSTAVATQIVGGCRSEGWTEAARESQRTSLLAALPSITTVSRASLLAGTLASGGQNIERAAFTKAAGVGGRLFYDADLGVAPGSELPPEVEDAISDRNRLVVAVVLNTVDDALSSGDPARSSWSVEAVRHLGPLLRRAAASDRTVVLVSDHGHVVDRGDEGTLRRADGGSRWRLANGRVREDEVAVTGRRVLADDGRIIAAVDETLRYQPRQQGYHGGLALAEVVIPLVCLTRSGSELPDGWHVLPPQEPAWWEATSESALAPADSLFGDNAAAGLTERLETLLNDGIVAEEDTLQRALLLAIPRLGSPCRLSALAREQGIPVTAAADALRTIARQLSDLLGHEALTVSSSRDRVELNLDG